MARSAELNPLAILTLSVIAERPRHPYEIYQVMMRRREDINVKIKPASLYHAVAKLAESGSVREVGTDRAGNRPERTTYEITDEGRERLVATITARLREPVNEYPVFPVAVSELNEIPTDVAIDCLRDRATRLAAEAEGLKAGFLDARSRGVPEAVLLDIDYLVATKSAEVRWINAVVRRLESGDLDLSEPAPTEFRPAIIDQLEDHRGSA